MNSFMCYEINHPYQNLNYRIMERQLQLDLIKKKDYLH